MIDYETYRRIHHLHESAGLTVAQIARELSLDPRTVHQWLDERQYRPRQSAPRGSKLDPYKRYVRELLEKHPYSAVQVFQRLRQAGYDGGITVVRDYVALVRPRRPPAFLTLSFERGECAQVDWGQYGSVNVGNTRRRLSFFVMVLCYSRLMYVEFTVSETLEHFLACHTNAFEFFGGCPARIMVDNLKSAVLRRLTGQAPVFNPRYVDFARHHGFDVSACNVAAGHEKGRVEAGVGYVKKNFLAGLEIPDFSMLNAAAREWLDTIANVRVHGETRRRPVDLFVEERDQLHPLPEAVYDGGTVRTVRASNRFRVTFETNRYSVPAEYASHAADAQDVSGPDLCLPPREAHRPAPAQLRPLRRLRGPRPSADAARAAPQRSRATAPAALPRPLAQSRGLLRRARPAAPQRPPPHLEDRGLERDLWHRRHRPCPRRRLRVHRLLERVRREPPREPDPRAPRALASAPHPQDRSARARSRGSRPVAV